MGDTKSKAPMSAKKANLIMLGFLLVFFAALFIMSQTIGGNAGRVPGIMSGLGFILTVIELIAQVRAAAKGIPTEEAGEPVTGLKWYYSLIVILSYIIILMLFGFIASTAIYLFVCPVLLGYRKWLVNLVFTVVSTIILYYGFVQLFMVQLPEGIIIANLLGR